MKKQFREALQDINQLLSHYPEEGHSFSVHIWDEEDDPNLIGAHYLYGPTDAPWLALDNGTPEQRMVMVSLPPPMAAELFPHRQLDVWVTFDMGMAEDADHGQLYNGLVYDISSRATAAEHIATYLKTGERPPLVPEGDAPKLH